MKLPLKKYCCTAQTFENGAPTVNDISTYNWTLVNNEEHIEAYRNVNTTFAVFQNITIAPKISWAQKDVDFNLGPPIKLRLESKMKILIFTCLRNGINKY